jgi:thiol-disulfide isomerase/thioredoxin
MIGTTGQIRSRTRTNGLRTLLVLGTLLGLAASARPLSADESDDKDQAKKPTLGDIIDRAAESVVLINTQGADGAEIGIGSGFVIDAKGLVATNRHVLRGATKAVVQFKNGAKCPVKGLRAVDTDADIAILEMDNPPQNLKALPTGPKTPPRQGTDVIAIGHPQGLSFSVTTGIVSAVRKKDQLPKEIADRLSGPDKVWIQTSAAISPGNSGGPLLDGQGRVIGINTWIADGPNLGFAIHIRHALVLLEKPSGELLPLNRLTPARDVDNPFAALEPRVEKILEDFRSAQRQFQIDLVQARDPKAARQIQATQNPGPKYAERLVAMAESHRKTTVAVQALFIACRLDAQAKDPKHLTKALQRLGEDHAADRGIHHVLFPVFEASVGQPTGRQPAADFLRQVIARNTDRKARGLSTYYLAGLLLADEAGKHEDEAARLLESCTKDYKDLAVDDGQTLGDLAEPLLYRLRYLSVGKTAPEIVAEDVDGKQFKLSDYRGKVVLVDFFADWCPHCERMYPHERQLVKDYGNRPFVLLGVNCDQGKDTLRQLVGQKKVTWRCWRDNTNRIAHEWQVDGYPTLYLLDQQGVIREIFHGRPEPKKLDEAIAKWVNQVSEQP